MPELLQGYDTVTQITALANWLQLRQAPAFQSIWIATDPWHTARAVTLARIGFAGRRIQIQPDPPPTPGPSEQRKLLRDALRLALADHLHHWRLAFAPDRCSQTGRLRGVGGLARLAFP